MKAGLLSNIKEISYTHINSIVPFEPSSKEDGKLIWAWSKIYNDVLDINITLCEKSFLGAVSFYLEKDCIKKAEVLTDSQLSGVYHGKTDGVVGKRITIPVSMNATYIILRLYGDTKDIILSDLELLGIIEEDKPLVYPTPKSILWKDNFIKIKDITTINNDADEVFVSEFLSQELSSLGAVYDKNGVSVVIDKSASPEYIGERYTVFANSKEIKIIASNRLSLLYGADTILKIYDNEKGLREFTLDDTPSNELRGFHMGLPMLQNFEFARRLFRYVLLPLRYNLVIVEFAGGMRFSRHPEISDAWENGCEAGRQGIIPPFPHEKMGAEGHLLEKEDVKRFIGYIKELGLSFVPEIQSLGHVQYITYAHPEIAEIGPKEETELDSREMLPSNYFPHCYCPSNEKSYEIIFDIIDEILEVSGPLDYVHIGHDEVYQIGLCEKCKDKDPGDLLAYHINRLYDYLSKKGMKVMMWADMLHSIFSYSAKASTAISKIPKDILLLDFVWYYRMTLPIEEEFLKEGFSVAVGNLYSSHFRNYKERVQKEGVVGGQLSTWVSTREDLYAYNGKFYDAIYLSQMLSSTDDYEERNRASYNKLINDFIQINIRKKVRGYKDNFTKKSIPLPNTNKGVPMDLIPLSKTAFALDKEIIKISDLANRIIFNHATINTAPRIPWQDGFRVGCYIINYADGSKESIPIEYGKNILSYKTNYGMPDTDENLSHMGYIGTWNQDPCFLGKNSNGESISTFKYIYDNPHPEKEIDTISYERNPEEYLTLMLSEIEILKD